MKTDIICIRRIKNTGKKRTRFAFTGFSIELNPEEVNEKRIVELDPAVPVVIEVSVAEGGLLPKRTVEIYYREEGSGIQFYYKMLDGPHAGEEQRTKGRNTPGSDIYVDIEYSGNGVVIVGTGDM